MDTVDRAGSFYVAGDHNFAGNGVQAYESLVTVCTSTNAAVVSQVSSSHIIEYRNLCARSLQLLT